MAKNAIANAKALPGNVAKAAVNAYRSAEQWLARNPKAAMALGAVAVAGGIGLTIATGGLAGLAIGGALAGAGTSTLLQGAAIADGKKQTFSLTEVGMGTLLGGAGGAIGGPLAAAAFKAAPTVVGALGLGAVGLGGKSAYDNYQKGNKWTALAEGAMVVPGALPFLRGKNLSAMFGKQAWGTTGRSVQSLFNGRALQSTLRGGRNLLQSGMNAGRSVFDRFTGGGFGKPTVTQRSEGYMRDVPDAEAATIVGAGPGSRRSIPGDVEAPSGTTQPRGQTSGRNTSRSSGRDTESGSQVAGNNSSNPRARSSEDAAPGTTREQTPQRDETVARQRQQTQDGEPSSSLPERSGSERVPTYETPYKPLTPKQRRLLKEKVENRTISRDEYKRLEWHRRFNNRRKKGVDRFWAEERIRLRDGESGTRNWSPQQQDDIVNYRTPTHGGKPIEGHHKYNALDHPQIADDPNNIYPATKEEHFRRWHGGSWRHDTFGTPLNDEFGEQF
jgi:GHH signature containing HNH/Endo VII superfamily nuclease toxin